jgi:hypothetical protein
MSLDWDLVFTSPWWRKKKLQFFVELAEAESWKVGKAKIQSFCKCICDAVVIPLTCVVLLNTFPSAAIGGEVG